MSDEIKSFVKAITELTQARAERDDALAALRRVELLADDLDREAETAYAAEIRDAMKGNS